MRNSELRLPGERWRDVPGLEGIYQVSNFGRIKGLARDIKRTDGQAYFRNERICTPVVNGKTGYVTIMFWHNSSCIAMALAPLVMKVWGKPTKIPFAIVGYRDGDKTNLKAKNLYWRRRNFTKGKDGSSTHLEKNANS